MEDTSAITIPGFNAGTRILSSLPFPTDCLEFLKEELVPGGVNLARCTVKHVDWANVRKWLKAVLGDNWDVQEGNVLAMEGCTFALWNLGNSTGAADEWIDVRVMVESCVGASDGFESFDLAASVEATQDNVATNILDGDCDPREVWVRGDLDDFGDYSLRQRHSNAADDSTRPGCVVVVAANSFVEIRSDAMTNAALRNAARKLLEHTVRRNGQPPLPLPMVTRDPVGDQDASTTGDVSVVRVKGIHTVFRVSFSVESEICVAGATCKSYGISFSRSLIHSKDANAPASGCLVHCVFRTRELGRHNVRVHFADALTMVCVSKDLVVDVTV